MKIVFFFLNNFRIYILLTSIGDILIRMPS